MSQPAPREDGQTPKRDDDVRFDSDTAHLPQSFVYTPLGPNQIRLLAPDPQRDGHAWSIHIANLENPTLDFDALSYTWGSQFATHTISINQHVFPVHWNLFTALPFLATRRTYQRPIWIDAMCINQRDDEEIASQIGLMSQIYRRATSVVVWLGLAEVGVQERVEEAIGMLGMLGTAGKMRYPELIEETKVVIDLDSDSRPDILNFDMWLWKAIVHIIDNPWYVRAWV